MPKKLIINGRLAGMNELIEKNRQNAYAGAKLKREAQADVIWFIRTQLKGSLREPVYMKYLWVEKDRRRDMDNVSAFGRKIIQDALVVTGRLKNDGWDNITGFCDDFSVDNKRPRIEVTIYEAGEEIP
jgi:Holliday junction resolvase RusA-like endonuclease